MAFVVADRVWETTTTTGTGTITLAGAVSGYQSFAAIGNSNTTDYIIVHSTLNEWEVNRGGTYTSSGTTLSRGSIITGSSGPGVLVNFSAGTKNVYCVQPAPSSSQSAGLVYQDNNGYVYQDNLVNLFPQSAFISNGSPVTYANASGTQAIFLSTPSITLKSNTYYMFEGVYVMYKTVSGNNVNMSLLYGGTATLYGISYSGTTTGVGTDTTGTVYDTAPIFFANTAATAFSLRSGLTAYNSWSFRVQGTVRVNAGGTFIPQFSLSGVPGTNYFLATGSYFKITPVGSSASSANISIGWA